MPGSKGFTGQRADSGSSGLDDYGARYYDPLLGQFAAADTVADGLNRYGYVHGNPTTFSDPSGHRCNSPDDMGCGGVGGGCTTKCGGGRTCTLSCTASKTAQQIFPCPNNNPCIVPSNPASPQPVPGPSCGGSGQQKCPGATPTCTSDANCGCYDGNCSGQVPGDPACRQNLCKVGEDRILTLLWLAGYDTSALMGRGKDGIGLLIGVLNSVIGKIAIIGAILLAYTTVVAGALIAASLGIGIPAAALLVSAGAAWWITMDHLVQENITQLQTLQGEAATYTPDLSVTVTEISVQTGQPVPPFMTGMFVITSQG